MDIVNLFSKDTDFNICKSWLCGSTDGQTYAINEYFGKKITIPAGMSETEFWNKADDFFVWQKWEDAIGYKHDYKIDDPAVDEEAKRMVKDLNALIDRLSADPDYLNWKE